MYHVYLFVEKNHEAVTTCFSIRYLLPFGFVKQRRYTYPTDQAICILKNTGYSHFQLSNNGCKSVYIVNYLCIFTVFLLTVCN